jgi:tetratricopeptide (TPR) repeat protein
VGGEATFSGTTYQARVIASIYAHVLAQTRLDWLTPADDTPVAVSGETGGPGDDARIELGEGYSSLEVQAKHGLTAGVKLQEVIEQIRARSAPGDQTPVAIIVDRSSSAKVYRELAGDLHRLRAGRQDRLGAEAVRLLRELRDASVLRRLFIVPLDVDREGDPEAKFALQLLTSVLENSSPAAAAAAWGVLIADAGELCARRLRRTRKELVDLLAGRGLAVRPAARDERWHRHLDFTRLLLKRRRAPTALMVLSQVKMQIGEIQVDPSVRYRLMQQQAAAALQLDRHHEALEYARRALDIDPEGIHALAIAAAAALGLGDLAIAQAFADQAVAAHPGDPSAWTAKTHVAFGKGETLPTPPSAIAQSPHYRTELAAIAASDGDWPRVLLLTEQLLAEGVQSPEVLFHRSNALLSVPSTGDPVIDRDRHENAERLATELVDVLADDGHPLTVKGLVLRATARRRLGRPADADADLTLARQLAAEDPDAIGHAARMKMEDGDEAGALQLLHHPVVDDTPELLTLRAHIHAVSNDDTAARRDLAAALQHAADTRDPDSVRFAAADTSLVLGDIELAERALDGVSADGLEDARYAVLQGRAALVGGRIEDGIKDYQEAGRRDRTRRAEYLAELGSQLLQVGKPAAAVKAFVEVGLGQLPVRALPFYGRALMEVSDFVRGQELIDRLAKEGSLPDWALGMATDIALRQDDVDAALRHLIVLVERAPKPHVRIELARRLLERGRSTDAGPHIDTLLGEPIAQLLDMAGRHDEARAIAFQAFRAAPHDPRFHRVFIVLTIRSKDPTPTAGEVGPSTYVRLRNQEGVTREHTIYAEPPIDPIRREMSVEEGEAAGLMGRKVGDVIVRNEGTWQEEQWTVEEIKPAILHVAQDAMLHYEDRFPGQPFFMKGFSIGDGTSVKDLAPIIASLEERKAHVLEIFKLYREQTFPIGFVVKTLGGSIAEAMDLAITDPTGYGPLAVEWSDQAGQYESRAAATDATVIVLTRSALKTAHDLKLLDLLAEAYRLIAPLSLRDELREEVLEAEQHVTEGHSFMASRDSRLHFQELDPGHPALVERLDTLRALLAWLETNARLDPRPLPTIHPPGSREEQARDLVGHSSYDAVALTQHSNLTIYADDLGLRRFVPKGARGRSFSTVGLLPALAERGLVTADERDRHLVDLVMRNYIVVPPSRELLEAALRRATELRRAGLVKTFGLLAGPAVAPGDAANIAGQVIKSLATASVQVVGITEVVELALEAMATRWPRRLSSQLLERVAAAELALMPQQFESVREACAMFARGG